MAKGKTVPKAPDAPKAPKKFDVEKLHKESLNRITKRNADRKRDHIQPEYDIDIEQSYELSLDFAETELQKKHLESVLSAGPCRHA